MVALLFPVKVGRIYEFTNACDCSLSAVSKENIKHLLK